MRRGFLLDTNQLTRAAADRKAPVVARIRKAVAAGGKVGTIVPVLCEAEAGFAGMTTERRRQYDEEVVHLFRLIKLWPMNAAVAAEYGAVYQELRAKGRALSQVDMMLAATARQMRTVLVTTDNDFTALPDIPVEDWTS